MAIRHTCLIRLFVCTPKPKAAFWQRLKAAAIWQSVPLAFYWLYSTADESVACRKLVTWQTSTFICLIFIHSFIIIRQNSVLFSVLPLTVQPSCLNENCVCRKDAHSHHTAVEKVLCDFYAGVVVAATCLKLLAQHSLESCCLTSCRALILLRPGFGCGLLPFTELLCKNWCWWFAAWVGFV